MCVCGQGRSAIPKGKCSGLEVMLAMDPRVASVPGKSTAPGLRAQETKGETPSGGIQAMPNPSSAPIPV